MSSEDVSKFEAKVKSDPKLLSELQGLQSADRGQLSAKISEVAQKHGFSVSAGEVDDYLKGVARGSELSDEALSGVAGGHWTYSAPGC